MAALAMARDASDVDTPFDPRALRNALGGFATGVTVVTTRAPDGTPVGLTVNSFSSVSLEPPLILWSLMRDSPSRAAFLAASHFAVNVLAVEQEALCRRFATPRPDKFEGVQWWAGAGGAPVLAGCVARFQCRRSLRHDGGDHDILLGRVEAFDHDPMVEPLVFVAGDFRRTTPMS
ncbi:flavin reductase family protein [Arhodomonas sp. SL1]|uniref:flavin reductase family protein n=1 Tax=Arhodomonas sp. SL1 TaxID=3425691 RepID=UPI003F883E98